MNELTQIRSAKLLELFADEVFDGFDVMARGGLNLGQARHRVIRKVRNQSSELLDLLGRERKFCGDQVVLN